MISVDLMPTAFKMLTYLNYLRFGVVASLTNSYGFGRCSELEINQTKITDMIPPDKALEILSSDKIDSELVVSTVTSLMSGAFGKDKRSEVLRQFNLYDSDYLVAIIMLVFHLIFYRYCTYLAIKSKIKAKS